MEKGDWNDHEETSNTCRNDSNINIGWIEWV